MITNIKSYSTTSNPAPQINSSKPTQNINRKSYDECKFTNTSTADSLFKNLINFTGSTIKKFSTPLVAIVGNFDQKIIDIDGDSIPDLSHEETISRIVKATCPDIQIKPFKIEGHKNNPDYFDLDQALEKLSEISEIVENGEKIDAVNVSLGKEILINTFRECTGLPVNGENIINYKDQIREWLKNPSIPLAVKTIIDFKEPGKSGRMIQEFKTINKIIDAIEQITDKGVPVYIGAGNEGPEYFNILALAKGSIPVGALDAKSNKKSFSADNSLINRFEQGIYNISAVTDKDNTIIGYDLTGDNKPEVLANEVSGGESKVKPYIGKSIETVIAQEDDYTKLIDMINQASLIRKIKSIPDYELSPREAELAKNIKNVTNHDIGLFFDEYTMNKKSKKVLFSIDAIAHLYQLNSEKTDKLKLEGNYINAPLDLIFKLNSNKKIVFDPDNSGRSAINEIFGTSFASPKAMAIDIKAKNSKN
ncbi:MAG: hypothetical protein A2104_07920 [Candidatus Melainabacteria bacterium GWF2_32_7]|nr:MAG: hypothetical protein A2104_07920 [Candidatus Melainabacteria bacterium GWF2_32_7]